MPEPHTQPPIQTATLQLDAQPCLAGELSALVDGSLKLASFEVRDAQPSLNSSTLRAGASGLLSLTDSEGQVGRLHTLRVVVTQLAGNTLFLKFHNEQDKDAKQCLSLLAETTAPSKARPVTRGSSAEVLQLIKQQSLSQFEELFQRFLWDLTDHLLRHAAMHKQATSGHACHYEGMTAIDHGRKSIIESVVRQLADNFSDLTPKHSTENLAPAPPEDTLDILGFEEFEQGLAIERMILIGREQHKIAMETLVIRLAELIDADPLEVRLPVSVEQICQAFSRSLHEQHIPVGVIPDIFDYFTEQVVRNLDTYYADLNASLLDHSIRPELEAKIASGGSILDRSKRAKKPRKVVKPRPRAPQETLASMAQQDESLSLGTPGAAQPTEQAGGDNANLGQFYESVINALNFRRESDRAIQQGSWQQLSARHAGAMQQQGGAAATAAPGANFAAAVAPGAAGSASAGGGLLANPDQLADVLGNLQHDPTARAEITASGSLQGYLAAHQSAIEGLESTAGLSSDSINQLDLVDNLFGTISSEIDLTTELAPALGSLQIPLAKLALLEPNFFADRNHPARAVVDKLAELATSANYPNKALETRIKQIVEKLILNYDSDSAVFDTALEKIDKLVAQQQRALARNVDRLVKTQEGQEKLRNAHRVVDRVIDATIPPPEAANALVELVESGWRDLLVLTHIKEGTDSRLWQEHVKSLELLSLWLSEQFQGEVDEDMQIQRALEADPFLDMISQQISAALPTSVAHLSVIESLREILAGRDPIIMGPVSLSETATKPDAATIRAKIETLPRLRRWVHRVERLQAGTWLSHVDSAGQKHRMKLAWISANRDRYIFVNERGQVNADLSAVELAKKLRRHFKAPSPTDKLSVVDQSMYRTLEHVQQSLSFDRNRDSLTKLINSKTFLSQMDRALKHAQTRKSQHAVLYLDIDQFKLVNDLYDEASGDQVLKEFANILAQLHNKKASSARIEGDQFAVLLLDQSLAQAGEIAQRICDDIANSSLEINGELVKFTVSIGVTAIAEHNSQVKEILDYAKSATTVAKQQGRNQISVFEEDQATIEVSKQAQLNIRENLQKTLETDRFVLRAQPIVHTAVNTSSASSQHYELLLGLHNEDGSLSSPQNFILSAERHGYMTQVDRWVIKEAFTWISALMDSQKVVPSLSINLSGTSITDNDFMDFLLDQISEYGVGTSRLCFEITEIGTIGDLVRAADFVQVFRDIGCKFSLDDFGRDLSSLNFLRELPVDYVKIDGSFVTNIHNDQHDYAMARAINDLAHFLGQKTIAECVETDEIAHTLREIGVDFLQGWGVGSPRLLSDITADIPSIDK